jgi:hypothetical protein
MRALGAIAVVAMLALGGCGPESARPEAAKARARIIPPGPTGPVYASVGVISEAPVGSYVVLDHEGSEGSGLAAGRTKFRTWGNVIAVSPGEPGARVAFKFQKLGEGWALVEMTER